MQSELNIKGVSGADPSAAEEERGGISEGYRHKMQNNSGQYRKLICQDMIRVHFSDEEVVNHTDR